MGNEYNGPAPARPLHQAVIEAAEEELAALRGTLQTLRSQIRQLESELGAMELENADLHMEIERLQVGQQVAA